MITYTSSATTAPVTTSSPCPTGFPQMGNGNTGQGNLGNGNEGDCNVGNGNQSSNNRGNGNGFDDPADR
ncbi:MAG: hypothetical protein JO144_01830 [Actinobacteria bacterium]|nr:hypothetical protein [Actinomycetota bacterium]